jgi:hypothetical protein
VCTFVVGTNAPPPFVDHIIATVPFLLRALRFYLSPPPPKKTQYLEMANLAQGWINHLRRQARKCVATSSNSCCTQLTLFYSDQPPPTDTREAAAPSAPAREPPPRASSNDKADDAARRGPSDPAPSRDPDPEDASPARKRLKSPTNSVKAGDRTRSPSPNRRSKQKSTTVDESTADFPARRTKGRLWNEGDPIPTRNAAPAQPAPAPQQQPRQSRRRDNKVSNLSAEEEDPSVNMMIGQPETRPISQEQLVAEVKGIYAGLVMCVAFSFVLSLSCCLRCPADRLSTIIGSSPSASRLIAHRVRKMIQTPNSTTNNGKH